MTNGQTNHPIRRRILRAALIILAVLTALALIAVSVYYALYWRGRADLFDRNNRIETPDSLIDNADDEGKHITYKGEEYRYNEAVVSLLFMGVDKADIQADGGYGENGQADSLFLAALDTANGNVKVIPLSRESMVDVNLYDADGQFIGTQKRQLCLAYAYGATAEEGCENTSRSVARLLYGMPIDGYVAVDFEGVKALNKAVGGVTVTPKETLKDARGTVLFNKGKPVRLNEESVLNYIRLRDDDADANNRRMQRQKDFLNEFITLAAKNVKKNFTLLEKYYNAAKPYTVSDLTLSEITYLTSTYLVGGQRAITYLSVTGESKQEGESIAFYADETSLYEAVLAAFYTKQ